MMKAQAVPQPAGESMSFAVAAVGLVRGWIREEIGREPTAEEVRVVIAALAAGSGRRTAEVTRVAG